MEPIKYPHRCIRDLFGYCDAMVKGVEIKPWDKSVPEYHGSAGECNNNPADCKFFVSNTKANPYHPELEKSVLKTYVVPPDGEVSEKTKQGALA